MFHTKDHKTRNLFDPFPHFGPKRRSLLEKSWAKIFRDEILPVLPVHLLRDHFHSSHGRPTKELYAILGAMVIQQNEDMTDEEAVYQLAFNELWHYALNINGTSDEASYFCEKTLWNIRKLIIEHSIYDVIFDTITEELAEICKVDTSKQRLDSVHIKSNMRHLGRIALFTSTIKKFLRNLKRQHKEHFASLEQELLDRYLSHRGESTFAMVKPSETEKTLETLAKDLLSLVERFRLTERICDMNTYQLLTRLLKEQCHVVEESASSVKKVTLKSNKQVPSNSLQNPSDPDAGYSGHKGKGYQVQVMETYNPEKDDDNKQLSLITYIEVEPANESDANALMPAIQDTQRRGVGPKKILADSLYGSDDNCEAAKKQGVDVIAPTMGPSENDKITLKDFTLSEDGVVLLCPEGNYPTDTKHNAKKHRHSARFNLDSCLNCHRLECCPVKKGKKGCFLGYYDKAARVAQRKAYEQTDAFREEYRHRAGIEATNSQYDRRTGVKHLRVRGIQAVRFAAKLKAAGINIRRATAFRNWQDAKAKAVPGLLSPIFLFAHCVRQILKEQLAGWCRSFLIFQERITSPVNFYRFAIR